MGTSMSQEMYNRNRKALMDVIRKKSGFFKWFMLWFGYFGKY